MNIKKIFMIMLLFILFFSGCATEPKSNKLPLIPNSSDIPKSDETLIIVRRASKFFALFSSMNILVDDQLRLKLENNMEGRIIVGNGNHTIYAEIDGITKSKKIDFVANSKEVVFLMTPEEGRTWYNTINIVMEENDFIEGVQQDITQVTKNKGNENTSRIPMDNIINHATNDIINKLLPKTIIALLNISSEETELAEYIVEEISVVLVNKGDLIVVDRMGLEVIKAEQTYQMSGEVSDETAISLGKILGAEAIITCTISGRNELRRMRIKTINVETGQIITLSSYEIQNK
jgi:PBP1b-binding outer membrane lipoprotein LpoB